MAFFAYIFKDLVAPIASCIVRISCIPDYSAEPFFREPLEVLHNVDDLAGGVRILDQAVVSLNCENCGYI